MFGRGTILDSELDDVSREWRHEYMTLLMRDQENMEKGIEQGIKQGMEKG